VRAGLGQHLGVRGRLGAAGGVAVEGHVGELVGEAGVALVEAGVVREGVELADRGALRGGVVQPSTIGKAVGGEVARVLNTRKRWGTYVSTTYLPTGIGRADASELHMPLAEPKRPMMLLQVMSRSLTVAPSEHSRSVYVVYWLVTAGTWSQINTCSWKRLRGAYTGCTCT
jgi:hypothetical protein